MKLDLGAGLVDNVEFAAMEEPALRTEIYTLPQLEAHALSVAQGHVFEPRKRGNKLLPRLRENERVLTRTYQLISDAAARKERVSPASEWLLDNFYLIEKQIFTVRSHLPRGYSRELPRLTQGPHAGFPRVYAIAFELISHADGKVDATNIKQFVNAYQTGADLRLGELWAIPIMLRLAIIENLRGVAIRIARSQLDRNAAAEWVERLVKTSDSSSTGVILTLADLSRATSKLSSTFVSELTRQLQGLGQNFSLVHSFVEQRLAEQGTTREESLHEENQRQAADQISIGNCIESLRALDAIDWREFVESSSSVERILLGDPLKVYASMDFATRDRYRHVVEKLARRTDVAEAAVAQGAVDCAFESAAQCGRDFRKHVGYYLVDDGAAELEQRICGHQLFGARLKRGLRSGALVGYVFGIVLLTALYFALAPVQWRALPIEAAVILAGVLALVASQLGVSMANWLATRFAPPSHLSRLDFSKQIPAEYKSVVAVPCMLTSTGSIDHLLEKLEIRYLGNRDRAVRFALLSDYKDADQQNVDGDEKLLEYASAGIAALNKTYCGGTDDVFYLFHRARKWNERERRWIGYERKRGKLAEFNHFLLKGEREGDFLRIVGDRNALQGVQFVITLDADTQLPAGSAQKLIGTLAHPLNRPYFDENIKRVTRGFGLLQPTAAVTLTSAQSTWFSRLYGGEPGIDPYTQLVSDVYQDLFGEGSFIGKGIYDVRVFEQTLGGVLPENRILSHDLLEGSYVRCGLATDIQIFEDFPSRYLADTARRHRWMRGDWQIGRWLLPWVPAFGNTTRTNPLAWSSKWKIFDNLRRSLVPIAFVAALLGGWYFATNPQTWTLYLLMIPALPVVLDAIQGLFGLDNKSPILLQFGALLTRTTKDASRAVLNVSYLPYEAWLSLDAVARTLFRLMLSGRRLLEWTTSSEAEQMVNTSLVHTARAMWLGPILGAAVIAAAVDAVPQALPVAAALGILWMISPLLALQISLPARKQEVRLSASDLRFLRTTARQTWAFFDRFVNAEENWLPPDNFQEQPISIIAHRTSPTNMGMALLANLAAMDLGYISVREMIERCQAMLASMHSLERSHGHFYNWYDTLTLKPLNPLYVSTVDSGNLACHLFTLQRGLLELADVPLVSPQMMNGIADTLRVMQERLRATSSVEGTELAKRIEAFEAKIDAGQMSGHAALHLLSDVKAACAQWSAEFTVSLRESEINWVDALSRQADGWLQTIQQFAPSLLTAGTTQPNLKTSLRTIASAKEGDPLHDPELAYRAQKAISELEALADLAGELAGEMDFGFLYVPTKKLFSIGYSVVNHKLDNSCYDLLASEARVASYVAIALGQVDQEHWFALGRQITGSASMATLVSWSGSMFEYLMPLLVMPTYEGTLLDQTYHGVVRQQMAYGKSRGVPWGISESGYNLTDAHLNYQYRAFGVPGLGLQRGLGEDLVIAPYATVMALMVAPENACRNMQRLSADDRVGPFGFYEAIDYTPSRLPPNQKSVPVSSYMAHHQGMSLLALDYVLHNKPMQRRFASEPIFKVADLLLQERVPKATMAIMPHPAEVTQSQTPGVVAECALRVVTDPSTPVPELHLLSNGRYHVMVNAAGSGYSRWKDLAVTRFREDAVRDSFGLFCYIRDVNSGAIWSTSYQPTRGRPDKYEAIFSEGRVEFRRRDHHIDLHTEISVSAEDDVEIRRTRVTNNSNLVRTLEFTSYGEVVITPQGADAAHPAFNNLFVQTQIDAQRESIICTRRPRMTGENPPVLFHSLAVRSQETGQVTFETSRATFIGRTQTLHEPAALRNERLSGSSGSVLDPIVSIRRTLRLQPGETVTVDLICGMTDTRDQSIALIDKYRDERLSDRVFDMAWTHAQVSLRQLNCTESEAQLYNKLAGSIIYASQHRRASAAVLAKNRRGQSGLWSYGISGDLPIVMVRISDSANLELVRQCVQAHAFWRMKGLVSDLVLTNDDPSVYRQALYDQIIGLIAAGRHAQLLDKAGGIFVRRAEQISEEDRTLLQTVARVVLSDSAGTFAEQVDKRTRTEVMVPLLKPPQRKSMALPDRVSAADTRGLKCFNGTGGFSADGSEYVTILEKNHTTPAPWVNVMANPTFGTVISESGGAYTWLENSHEYRLTPWSNDPVTDTTGEAIYIRDDESGLYWSPTPLPSRGPSAYVVRHGFGYSTFETSAEGISSTLSVYVAMDAPMKFMRLKLVNRSGRTRKLSTWGYFEWVLAELRGKSHMHITTEIDPRSGAIFARNPYSSDFPGRVAFVSSSVRPTSYSGDRTEFIGRNGTLKDPVALSRLRLSGRVGAGLDPCAALHVPFTLGASESIEVVFELGIGQDPSDVQNLLGRFGQLGGAQQALTAVKEFWNETLSGLNVETPDPKVDLLANGWLLYQTLSCRMWARTGFYQSGGAFGFRDQLQDSMALLHSHPALTRQHLLMAARHQFREGDVQHWWHTPSGRGVRTHFSDDYLWLPFAACQYAKITGDARIFDEAMPFVEGRQVNADEESYYDLPLKSEQSGTLYDHCARAIEHGLRYGVHGLPLMGCGDWNDGMNRIGVHGKGESVWLAFFLFDVLTQFEQVARVRGDTVFAERCAAQALLLRQSIEANAWDGNWYRRAYFDDGTPLGSAENAECQIDSLPQSWSILSGAGDPERSRQAMECVNARLIKRDEKLIQLFEPPFNSSKLDPGYIKGYVPGVRENGGQYTHAALWVIMAFAKLGRHETAWELLSIVNPINHALTPATTETYKVEPYVVAADIYGVAPHVGRGGWTWYTGSAGWMYRTIMESLLGFHIEKDVLRIQPCVPADWKSFKLKYQFWDTSYEFTILPDENAVETEYSEGENRWTESFKLVNDAAKHQIQVRVRCKQEPPAPPALPAPAQPSINLVASAEEARGMA